LATEHAVKFICGCGCSTLVEVQTCCSLTSRLESLAESGDVVEPLVTELLASDPGLFHAYYFACQGCDSPLVDADGYRVSDHAGLLAWLRERGMLESLSED
jgi:hypothetical protein